MTPAVSHEELSSSCSVPSLPLEGSGSGLYPKPLRAERVHPLTAGSVAKTLLCYWELCLDFLVPDVAWTPLSQSSSAHRSLDLPHFCNV